MRKSKCNLQSANYLTMSALARYLSVSPSWVCRQYQKWADEGLRFAVWNGRKFFFRKDVDRIMERNCQVAMPWTKSYERKTDK
jgi:hypothetical protein